MFEEKNVYVSSSFDGTLKVWDAKLNSKNNLLKNFIEDKNTPFDNINITMENKYSLHEIEYFLVSSDYSKFMIKFKQSK